MGTIGGSRRGLSVSDQTLTLVKIMETAARIATLLTFIRASEARAGHGAPGATR